MKKPKDLDIPCPACGNLTFETKQRGFSHIVTNKINKKLTLYAGSAWFYECTGCGETFTTSESDTISMKNLKKTRLKSNEV